MAEKIRHRGPDNLKVETVSPRVIFGHTRLSIVDLSEAANQPMSLGAHTLAFNGEIFNHQELRRELPGATFKSHSDTETLLHLLVKQGTDCLVRLDGFFAFAYYAAPYVYLVRDFFGKKPLYYSIKDHVLYFASEINALFESGGNFELDETILEDVSRFRFARSLCPYAGIDLVPPGSFLRLNVETGDQVTSSYYSLLDAINPDLIQYREGLSENQLADELESLLARATRKRLLGDVTIGTICSGGVDSSLVSALAAKAAPVELFHVNVLGDSELAEAELVARHIGSRLHTIDFDGEYFRQRIHDAVKHYEFPMIHPNNVGIFAVAELARQKGVPVLLGGEAADELFGGYFHHRVFYRRHSTHNTLGNWGLGWIERPRPSEAMAYTGGEATLLDHHVNGVVDQIASRLDGVTDKEYLAFLIADLYFYLPPLLLRGDKLLMASSVELRLPFMDRDLVEFSLNLPSKYRRKKQLLKTVARRHLPASIVDRKKKGFAIPSNFFPDASRKRGMIKNEQSLTLGTWNILKRQ